MFKKRNFLLLLAASALMVACGGGGSEGTGSLGNAGGDSGVRDKEGENTAVDQQLRGHLSMVANQVLYIKRDGSMYLPVKLDDLESDIGIDDVASGYREGEPEPPVYRDGSFTPDRTLSPAAPIAAFGIRVDKRVQRNDDTETVANQSAVGRVAVSLEERADSPGSVGGTQREIMRFVIDNVRLSTNELGELSVEVLPDAQAHVYGRNAAGTEVRESIPVPTDAVRMLPMSRVPDNEGDDTSVVLLFDFEKAFMQSAQKLAALHDIAGHFAANITLSSAKIVRPASDRTTPPLERKELVGAEITVNDQPAVQGGGLIGNAWIRMYGPPRQYE